MFDPEATLIQAGIVEPEADDYADADSTFGSELVLSTDSIGSSILKYRQENGRTYHAYKDGQYLGPNDDAEQDRLDLEHHLQALTLDGRLFTAPIPKEKILNRVLDVGTGTGIWAIDFADEHPESQVLGIDLSPIQPQFTPPNCSFEVDDIEAAWTFTQPFDYIHSRMMSASLGDWPKYFRQAYANLTPGGWIEAHDASLPLKSDDGTLLPDSALMEWVSKIMEGASNLGRPLDEGSKYKANMEAAGFVDIVETVYKWPTNQWPKDKRMKEIGMWALEDLGGTGLNSVSMAILTRGLGWTATEVEVFLADVRKDLKNTKIHAYWPIYVTYGRKPE